MTGEKFFKALFQATALLASLTVYLLLLVLSLVLLLTSYTTLTLPLVQNAIRPLGIDLKASSVDLNLFPLQLAARDITLDISRDVKVHASIGQLKASGRVDDLFLGDHRLESLMLVKPDITLVMPPSDEKEDREPVNQEDLWEMLPAGQTILTRGRFQLKLPEDTELVLQDLEMEASNGKPAKAGASLSGRLRVLRNKTNVFSGPLQTDLTREEEQTRILAQTSDMEITFPHIRSMMKGRVELSVDRRGMHLHMVEAGLERARITPPDGLKPFVSSLHLSASAPGPEQPLSFIFRADKLGQLKGTLTGPLDDPRVQATGTLSGPDFLLQTARSMLPSQLQEMSLKGHIPFQVDYMTSQKLDLKIQLHGLKMSLPELDLSAALHGTVLLGDMLADPLLRGSLDMTGVSLERTPVSLRNARLRVKLSGAMKDPEIPGFSLTIPGKNFLINGQPLELGKTTLTGSISIDHDQANLENLVLDTERLGKVYGRASLKGGRITGKFRSDPVALASLIPFAGPSWPAGWTAEGEMSVKGSMIFEGGMEDLSLDTTLTGVSFANPQGSFLGQNLSFSLSLGRKGIRRPVTIAVACRQGELLMETVYLDLSAHNLELDGSLLPRSMERYEDVKVQARLTDLINLHISEGRFHKESQWVSRGRLEIRDVDFSPVFRTFVREPLAFSHPVVNELTVGGRGSLGLDVLARGDALYVNGRLTVDGVDIRRENSESSIHNLSLNLPMSYAFIPDPGPPEPVRSEEMGLLSIDYVQSPLGEFRDISMPVILVSNRLILHGDLFLPFYNGGLSISNPVVDEPLSRDFVLNVNAGLEEIDLSMVPSGDFTVQGALAGNLGRIELSRNRLHSPGTLLGTFFGGPMTVTDITGQNIFSSARSFGADIMVDNMHMEPLSRTLGVGKVTGRMDVDLEDLRIAYGQPVSLNLTALSDEVEDVPQKVSLDAVNSISVVGTGASLTSTAITLFKPFVQEFHYDKIGISCDLENDVFKIRGLIHSGGVEYLVKKPPLFGINVINRNPDNRISFKDMLERINRVIRPAAEEGENSS